MSYYETSVRFPGRVVWDETHGWQDEPQGTEGDA